MSCIGFPREADAGLHDMYSSKLLIPGWAGEVSDAEAQYIADELAKSQKLRLAWGIRPFFGRRWKHISSDMAKRLCLAWARNPPLGVKGLSTASGEKTTEEKDTNTLGKEGQLALL